MLVRLLALNAARADAEAGPLGTRPIATRHMSVGASEHLCRIKEIVVLFLPKLGYFFQASGKEGREETGGLTGAASAL